MSLTDDEISRLEEILAAVDGIRGKLRDWDKNFYEDIEHRYDEKGGDLHLSAKQWAQLERIFALA